MKIRNIEDIKANITQSTILIFSIIFSFALAGLYVTHNKFINNTKLLHESEIFSAYSHYRANLSEKFSIIASSTVFLDYLRSGEATRKHLYPQLLLQITSLKPRSITGMELLDEKGGSIFRYGNTSNTFISLQLCYFNQTLDPMNGDCHYSWKLYFLKSVLVNEVININKNLVECRECNSINLFQNDIFGAFIINEKNDFGIKIRVQDDRDDYYYLYLILIMAALIIFGFWSWYYLSRILNRYITDPLSNLAKNIKSTDSSRTKNDNIEEIQYLIDQIDLWQSKINKMQADENAAKLGKIAAQLAHDIRSPLSAIDMLIKNLNNIPDMYRSTLRNATIRISDIANNFLAQYHTPLLCHDLMVSNEHIPSILEYILSEKRSQYSNREIEFSLNVNNNNWVSFSAINSSEFKRALSNLIDNAVESIPNSGDVCILHDILDGSIRIEISDNGHGIPSDMLPKILNGGFSIGKKNGFGLGLAHARQHINTYGGSLDIQSQIGNGTIIGITLPLSNPPSWFCNEITIQSSSNIVILDDDPTTHAIWNNRFSQMHDLSSCIYSYSNTSEFSAFFNKSYCRNVVYLIDYEFANENLNGFDIIERYKLSKLAILVTNRHDDYEIQQRCLQLDIKILPKVFISHIEIKVARHEPTITSP